MRATSYSQPLKRRNVPALDEILGIAFPVLDDGFIRVVDYLGDDETIEEAARLSYGDGTRTTSKRRGLIRFLMRHRHTTPFEKPHIQVHLRIPMDAWRQWVRHRMANINEYSTRYSLAIDSAQTTGIGEWREQSTTNRQGSGGFLPEELGRHLSTQEATLQRMARDVYEERISAGVAREQARKDLPLSTYTEIDWTCDMHNLLHFLGLRMAPDAQKEIREYARVFGEEIARRWCPTVWEAFKDYRLNAVTFSGPECTLLRAMETDSAIGDTTWTNLRHHAPKLSPREAREFAAKLERVGFEVWAAGIREYANDGYFSGDAEA